MKGIRIVVAVALIGVGTAAAQEAPSSGAVRSYSESLSTGIYESTMTANISAYKETGGLQYAEYLIDTDAGDHVWCRTEEFSLSVTPRSASLTFVPSVEESCPDPKLVTVVCRVSDDSNTVRDVCTAEVTNAAVRQVSHVAARELWGMDCAVAVGELSASEVWGVASNSRATFTPAQ
jgi:hypothetical protein